MSDEKTWQVDVQPPRAAAEAAARTAVFVAHGMGQQVPLETLQTVADGLRKRSTASATWDARTVLVGGEQMQRLEIGLTDGERKQRVDVYEAYWAPLTEGAVTLRDVFRFLFSAF